MHEGALYHDLVLVTYNDAVHAGGMAIFSRINEDMSVPAYGY